MLFSALFFLKTIMYLENTTFMFPAVLYTAIRGLHAYPNADLSPGDSVHLFLDEEFSEKNDVYSVEVMKVMKDGQVKLGGHLAKEVSRLVYKWIKKEHQVDIIIYENFSVTKNDPSYSLRAGGSEIGCKVIFECMDLVSVI